MKVSNNIMLYMFCVGINAHEGINVWMNAGIALAVCFSILATIIIVVNLIHKKGCKGQA